MRVVLAFFLFAWACLTYTYGQHQLAVFLPPSGTAAEEWMVVVNATLNQINALAGPQFLFDTVANQAKTIEPVFVPMEREPLRLPYPFYNLDLASQLLSTHPNLIGVLDCSNTDQARWVVSNASVRSKFPFC